MVRLTWVYVPALVSMGCRLFQNYPPLSDAEQGQKPSRSAPAYPGTLHEGRSQFEGEDPEVRPHINSDSSLKYQTLHTYTGTSLLVRAAYLSMTLSDILDCKTLVEFSSDFRELIQSKQLTGMSN